VEIDEKVHQADDGKDYPAVGITVLIRGAVFHLIFPELTPFSATICGHGDIAPKLSLQGFIIYGAIRSPVYYRRMHQGVMVKATKACQHIHGSAFVVNGQIL